MGLPLDLNDLIQMRSSAYRSGASSVAVFFFFELSCLDQLATGAEFPVYPVILQTTGGECVSTSACPHASGHAQFTKPTMRFPAGWPGAATYQVSMVRRGKSLQEFCQCRS